jgi:hypothetical protein
MDCRGCGASIKGNQEFCANCGQTVAKSNPLAPTNPELTGVAGWLLLLCVLLTIVLPLSNLYGTARSLRYHPDTVVLLFNAINVGLGILSLAAGVMLWRVRNHAVTVAKVFFVLSPVHALGIFCLVVYSGHVADVRTLVVLGLRIMALPFLFSLLWYWYLLGSQRVRNTYAGS